MPARFALVAALAIACHGVMAQTQIVPPALAVQRLAPQLVAFAGSEANFQSLVTGLSQGTQVQLFSVLPTGFVQTVTFTPAAAMTPEQIAQLLETARQRLIGMGIGNPTAEQIGFTLMGGLVPTALGGSHVSGLLTAQSPPSRAAQVQGQAGAGATAPPSTTPGATNSVNVQTTPGTTPAPTPAPRASTSDSLVAPGATSRSSIPLTSASPIVNTPVQALPGAGSTPPAVERVPAGAGKARN